MLASYVYNHDEAGRLTSEFDNGVTASYSYNADNELTGSGSTAYSYDATGNRTMTGYVTGPDNKLLSDGTNSYTYDADGNLQSKIDGTDITTYTYNHENQLVGVIETVGGTLQTQAKYVYDVFGDRIETEEYTATGGAVTTEYAYNGVNVWAQLSGPGTLEMRQFFLDGQGQVMARVFSAGTASYDTDHLGRCGMSRIMRGRWFWIRLRTMRMGISRARRMRRRGMRTSMMGMCGMGRSNCIMCERGITRRRPEGGMSRIQRASARPTPPYTVMPTTTQQTQLVLLDYAIIRRVPIQPRDIPKTST